MAKDKNKKAKAKDDPKGDLKALRKKLSKLRKKLRKAHETVATPSKGPMISPLAPAGGMPDLPTIAGVDFAVAEAGVRYKGRLDVMLARLAPGTQMAGVFTRSATRAAPVLDCEAKIGKPAGGAGAAIIVNSGNANAFTGAGGQAAVESVTAAVSTAVGVPQDRVFSSSTGVIGEPLPYDRITAVLGDMAQRFDGATMPDAARAIMTTDTFPKAATTKIDVDGETITIAGIAKGSGMIAPDMATMLVYIFTDAKIAQVPLQQMLSTLTDETFNAITVDGDTSTSDTLLMAATGQSAAPEITDLSGPTAVAFNAALKEVMLDLSHQVVKDGEGATKFVEVAVTGAADDTDAKKVAMAIANSPLVKTAVAGEDPNWGRVVMAVGKSGAKADRDLLSIRFGDILVAEKGWVSPNYTEDDGATYMKQPELVIGVDMGLGDGAATVWTCDLTHRYIEINADYRS
ncbi:bifunctional glutamate N-acetyltransferase/amino-acid acetyltransferase ArgJ [Actibacterium lipolyticum]|uniref:Arginine biosynthesis bifunctional protein ArgJ n=1 Tax=Actibacterium lipolyticum TaxID=1524263 RepID=A0A238KVN1_9RHOB|nr:bifunctional glutamate N-acetyltransferase/amino-acid acetyltransferase ArgJ [Actibacterium lipolyticum]SMX46903.1 Arginine biosynthesis bifunctional protein ArgJ [Actibacterium lipolyticum]